eukprot:110107_1
MGFKPPFYPGQDYSGKVVQIGSKVTNFKVGDSVFGEVRLGEGTAVEYIVVTEQEKEIYKLSPDAPISMHEAASLQCSLETAYQSLTRYGPFEQNQTILILGGSTVIGMYCIQIAKQCFNAKNITVTSSQEELCTSLGANVVINYKQKEWQKELKDANFDYVLDVIGGAQSWTDCQEYNVIKSSGKYVTVCGDFEGDQPVTCCVTCGVMCGVLNRKFWGCVGDNPEYHMVNQERSKDIEAAVQLVLDGKVKPLVDEDSPYALQNYLECYEKSMARKAHGKTLIRLVDNDGSADVEEEEQKHDL